MAHLWQHNRLTPAASNVYSSSGTSEHTTPPGSHDIFGHHDSINIQSLWDCSSRPSVIFFQDEPVLRNSAERGTNKVMMSVFLYLACPTLKAETRQLWS